MINIGIIGDPEPRQIFSNLQELFRFGESTAIHVEAIEAASADKLRGFEILIINDDGHIAKTFLKHLRETDFVIMNADNKNLYRCLQGGQAKLITYGFSSKACVTASSVMDEAYKTVQLCVQRNIPTLSGGTLEQQEFSVNIQTPYQSIYSILAAVTGALLAGIPVEKIAATEI